MRSAPACGSARFVRSAHATGAKRRNDAQHGVRTGDPFNVAQLGPPTCPFANAQAAGLNNINLHFLVSNLGWIPTKVYFIYLDEGGTENLSVNGSAFYIGNLHLAPASVGGRYVTVSTWVPGPDAMVCAEP